MFNLIDIIIILIILLTAFIGYKRGFVKTLISLSSFFVAAFVAMMFYKPLAVILTEKTEIDEWLRQKVVDSRFTESGELIVEEALVSGDEDELQTKIYVAETQEEKANDVKNILSTLPETMVEKIDLTTAKENIKQELANKLSELIMNLLSLISLFVLVRITLVIAEIMLSKIVELPVLKQINEVLGMSLGAAIGFIAIYVSFALITFISSVADISFVVSAIKSSAFASVMFESNLILKLLL